MNLILRQLIYLNIFSRSIVNMSGGWVYRPTFFTRYGLKITLANTMIKSMITTFGTDCMLKNRLIIFSKKMFGN